MRITIIGILCLYTVIALNGCSGSSGVDPGPPVWEGLTYTSDSISFDATLQMASAEGGSWHLIVYENGSNASLSFFITEVTAQSVYEALAYIGGTPGNNVNTDNIADPDIATGGDTVEVTFNWTGAPKEYSLDEIVTEEPSLPGGGPFGCDIKFGGNYEGAAGTNPADGTGCLICLYTCSAGITSNANANLDLFQTDGEWRYVGNTDILPADGTIVSVTVRLIGS